MKWWKVFWRLIELAIVNSYIIYNSKEQMTHRKFRLKLCHLLIEPLLNARVEGTALPGPSKPGPNIHRLTGKHFPTGAEKGAKLGRCQVCAKQKNQQGKYEDTKTANRCNKCDVYLCVSSYFEKYHTRSDIYVNQTNFVHDTSEDNSGHDILLFI